MLDIISMITLIIIFSSFATFMMLIIIGGNMNKSKEEQRLEDEEQMEYLRQYREKKLNKKRKFGGNWYGERIIYMGTSSSL